MPFVAVFVVVIIMMFDLGTGFIADAKEKNNQYCQTHYDEINKKIEEKQEHIVFPSKFIQCENGQQLLKHTIEADDYMLEGESKEVTVIKKNNK